MKRNLNFLYAVVCAALLAHETGAEPAAAPKSVDGDVVAQQIQAKLQNEGFSPLSKVDVETAEGGIVSLKGIVVSDAEAARAVALAKEVSGVTSVKSEILVKRIQ
jgi:hyperosmotically inducible periplasmic protein